MAIVYRDEEHRKRMMAIARYVSVSGDEMPKVTFIFGKPKRSHEQMLPLDELFYIEEEPEVTNAD